GALGDRARRVLDERTAEKAERRGPGCHGAADVRARCDRALQALFAHVRVLVDAGDGRLSRLDGFAVSLESALQLRLERAGREHGREAAGVLDRLELLPRSPRETVGDGLDVPAPAGRVDDAMDVRFMTQDVLRVARDAAAEVVALAERRVEARRRDRVRAADDGREGLGGAADLIDPGVVARLGPPRGAGVNDHRRGLAAACRHDLRPGRARGAKLGDLDEEVAPDAE